MILKCIAIDDEPLALDLITDYIEKVEFLELVGKCTDVFQALNLLKEEKIDVLFLDIQMPQLTGFDLLESIKIKPQIIFTTAFEKYALKSYDYEAVDYLLKPITFSRFYKAINKLVGKIPTTNQKFIQKTQSHIDFIFLHDSSKIIKINIIDIEYIRGWSNYIIVKTANKKYVVRDNLKNIDEFLKGYDFIRVHKSFIVPIDKIESIEGNNIRIMEENIPIGKLYRDDFLSKIKDLSF